MLGKENQFLPMECLCVYQPHSRAGPMPRSNWPTESRLQTLCFCMCAYFLLGFFFCLLRFLFWLSCSVFFFFFSFWERGQEHESWSQVGREKWMIFEELGEGKEYGQHILYIKKKKNQNCRLTWRYTDIILALRRLRQGDFKFMASLGHTISKLRKTKQEHSNW